MAARTGKYETHPWYELYVAPEQSLDTSLRKVTNLLKFVYGDYYPTFAGLEIVKHFLQGSLRI